VYSNYWQLPVAGTVLTAATEIAALSTPPTNPPQGQLVIRGYINATGGATGGGWVIKCRRGVGTGGTQVGPSITVTYPATTTSSFPFSFSDAVSPLGGNGVYTITITAAGSNGTLNDAGMDVYSPEPFGMEQ
jgi:hypothetical protein